MREPQPSAARPTASTADVPVPGSPPHTAPDGAMTDLAPIGDAETWQAEPADPSPPVVYIAGSGRSGSTILERVLGQMPGFVNVGELIDLYRRSPEGERCGCGLPFTACPFWLGVGKRAFGGWDTGCLSEIGRLQARVARQRHVPRLLGIRAAGHGFQRDVSAYGAYQRKLYSAIAAEAGAQYVVDSTKWPVQALALARSGVDIRVIHLVRDVRGVAYSLGKKDVARPHALDEPDLMWRNTPAGAAARWVACQGQAELLRSCGVRITRVHYEDFIRQPRRTVEVALARLGLPHHPSQLAHVGDRKVTLGKSHGLSGNPSRFRDGETVLNSDGDWRYRMTRRDRAIVAAISLPFLLGYARDTGAGQIAIPPQRAKWPDVSVIITTRGRPDLVREAIAGVAAQTYPGDIDCLVVHDQEPPDEGLVRLGTPRCRVRVMANTRAPGLAGARNTGVGATRADYIATCDDDDVWHPDKLEAQIARLLDEPELLAVGSGLRLLLPGGTTQDWPGRADRISYQLLLRNRVKELHSSTLVMRREAFTKAGHYDEKIPFGYPEDYDWVLRIAKMGGLGLVRRPLADIRRNGTSGFQGAAEKVSAGLEYLLAKHPDFTTSRRGHARLLGQIAFARSALGERGRALRLTAKSLALWPASPYPYIALVHIVTGTEPRHLMRAARLFRREVA
jgi:glycosyltransferase involved in cell wall biosynthesis